MKNWKRMGSILCAAVLTMSLVACASEEKPENKPPVSSSQVPKQETAVSSEAPTPVPVKEWKAPEPELISLGGGGGGAIPDEWLVDENTQLPETMPVYRNSYAHGFVFTEELDKKELLHKAENYLKLFYQDEEFRLDETLVLPETRKEAMAQYVYEDDSLKMRLRGDHFLIEIKRDLDLFTAVKAGDKEKILSSSAIQAAIETAELKNFNCWAVNGGILHADEKPELSYYLLSEAGKDAEEDAYNRKLRNVRIETSFSPKVEIWVYYRQPSQKAELPVLSYGKALESVKEKFPNYLGEYRCTVSFMSFEESDKLIPCYEFLINGKTQDDRFAYYTRYVPMVDYESVTEEDYETIEELQEESSSEPVSSEPEPVSSELSEPETVTSLPPEEN